MRKRSLLALLAIATFAAAVAAGLGSNVAFAGEVKGPPGQPCTTDPVTGATDCVHNTNTTGALDHASSPCAASGLNDMDPAEGQTASQVQTAADSWKFYGLPKGTPGHACNPSENAHPNG
jgi:hypothetical protein